MVAISPIFLAAFFRRASVMVTAMHAEWIFEAATTGISR
jgi:hypothetical protein